MRIVFMGTPEFAVPCLERLVFDGYDVVGVFTQPDKPKGRGHKMQFPPVKEKAAEFNITVFQPTKMKDGTAYGILKELDPELIIVVAYGKIIPQDILDLPKYGCVNITLRFFRDTEERHRFNGAFSTVKKRAALHPCRWIRGLTRAICLSKRRPKSAKT